MSRDTMATCATLIAVVALAVPAAAFAAPWGLGALDNGGGDFAFPVWTVLNLNSNVEVLVNKTVYESGAIQSNLDQYLADLRYEGYNPIVTPCGFRNPAQVRSHLQQRWGTLNIEGAVIVGDLPIPYFERHDECPEQDKPAKYSRFPCDLYYQDLNGTWSDLDKNGTLDAHLSRLQPTRQPEIWLGRIAPSPVGTLHPGRTEAGLLDSYLAKLHTYREKNLNLPKQGLAYIDDDWVGAADKWGASLGLSLGGNVDIVKDKSVTTAADYKTRLQNGYESVLVAVHSDPVRHGFHATPVGGSLFSSDLEALDPQVFTYNLFACSNARYDQKNCMGVEYVFGTSQGLLALGSAKAGGMISHHDDYYTPLGQGKSFGEALKNWWTKVGDDGYDSGEMDWFYGMTLVGDPLLTVQQFRTGVPIVRRLADPGFERGLFGGGDVIDPDWSLITTGDGSGSTSTAHGGLQPVEGDVLALLETGGPDSSSALSQSFFLEAGATLSGWAAFGPGSSSSDDDYAQVRIWSGSDELSAILWQRDAATGGGGGDRWEPWEWTAPAAGAYTLEYATASGAGSDGDGWALFDGGGPLQPLTQWQVGRFAAGGLTVAGAEASGTIHGPGGLGTNGMGICDAPFDALNRTVDLTFYGALGVGEYATVKGYYTDAELEALGIIEESMRLYWHDGTEWQLAWNGTNSTPLPSNVPPHLTPGDPEHWFVLGPPTGYGLGYHGVDPMGNYVWANVDHASTWGLGGHWPEPTSAALVGLGLAVLARRRRRQRQSRPR